MTEPEEYKYFEFLIEHSLCELENMLKTEKDPEKKVIIEETIEECNVRNLNCDSSVIKSEDEKLNKQAEEVLEKEVDKKDKEEWQELATVDKLTGLYNRLAYDMIIEEIKDDVKYFFIIDVDHFKNVNDEYGHLVGDEVLKELATTLQEDLLISRWGGEEFVGLLTDDNPEEVLNNIREKISKLTFFEPDLNITVTIGYTDFDKEKDTDLIFQEADAALFCGKESGRNKVLNYEEDMEDVCPAHITNEDGELVKNEGCETCDETEKEIEIEGKQGDIEYLKDYYNIKNTKSGEYMTHVGVGNYLTYQDDLMKATSFHSIEDAKKRMSREFNRENLEVVNAYEECIKNEACETCDETEKEIELVKKNFKAKK